MISVCNTTSNGISGHSWPIWGHTELAPNDSNKQLHDLAGIASVSSKYTQTRQHLAQQSAKHIFLQACRSSRWLSLDKIVFLRSTTRESGEYNLVSWHHRECKWGEHNSMELFTHAFLLTCINDSHILQRGTITAGEKTHGIIWHHIIRLWWSVWYIFIFRLKESVVLYWSCLQRR